MRYLTVSLIILLSLSTNAQDMCRDLLSENSESIVIEERISRAEQTLDQLRAQRTAAPSFLQSLLSAEARIEHQKTQQRLASLRQFQGE